MQSFHSHSIQHKLLTLKCPPQLTPPPTPRISTSPMAALWNLFVSLSLFFTLNKISAMHHWVHFSHWKSLGNRLCTWKEGTRAPEGRTHLFAHHALSFFKHGSKIIEFFCPSPPAVSPQTSPILFPPLPPADLFQHSLFLSVWVSLLLSWIYKCGQSVWLSIKLSEPADD